MAEGSHDYFPGEKQIGDAENARDKMERQSPVVKDDRKRFLFPGEQAPTRIDLDHEFNIWEAQQRTKGQLPVEPKSVFLLNRTDDGSHAFDTALRAAITDNNYRLEGMGDAPEAQVLKELTDKLSTRLKSMWVEEKAPDWGVRSVRVLSPVPTEK